MKALSTQDQERAGRFRFPEDRERFLLGRILLLRCLSTSFDLPLDQLALAVDPKGRPHLPSQPEIHFSITHAGDLVAVAAGRGCFVGIDIEQIRARHADLLRHVFDETDRARFEQIAPEDHAAAFFQAWTGKEAYLKATGLGLAGGLRQVHVPLTRQTRAGALNEDPAQAGWRLQTLELPPGYAGNVVWNDPAREPSVQWPEHF